MYLCTAECVAFIFYIIVLLLVILDFTHFPAKMTGSGTMVNLQRTRC